MAMKLGLGFHKARISRENFRFARQAGCTHAVVHLVDRYRGEALPGTDPTCFGQTRARGRLWSEDSLREVKTMAEDEGLTLEAVENIDPSFWCDVLLDGPRKQEQMEGLKTLVRRLGKVGIPILGYNFSIAGVWGRVPGPVARGGAVAAMFSEKTRPAETPVPRGQLGNLVYDPAPPPGDIGTVSPEQIWRRFQDFLEALVPVAEEAGVRLAAHPDDPPLPVLRGTARLIHRHEHLRQVLELVPSRANALEFCLGTLQEMAEGDLYETVDRHSREGAIAYIHFRNVRGKAPRYHEVFVDEGDLDMIRVLRILRRNGYDGVLIPDHAPEMTCDAPWHAGCAHAIGYMLGALQALEKEDEISCD